MNQRHDESQDWQTPPEFLALVREVFGGPIRLDPCTTPSNPTGAEGFYHYPAYDGRACSWLGRSPIYFNPPYGREINTWIEVLLHYVGQGEQALGLLPARTDTKWFHRVASVIDEADGAICFLKKRIRFIDPATGKQSGYGKFPSAVPYWGAHVDRFARVFGPHGWVVRG